MKHIKLKNPDGFLAYAKNLVMGNDDWHDFIHNIELVIKSLHDRELVGMKTTIEPWDKNPKWFISNLMIKNENVPCTGGIHDQWWFDSMELKNYFEVFDDEPVVDTISKDEVEDHIQSVHYFTAEQGIENTMDKDGIVEKHSRYLFCVITLKNGLVFHGVNSGGMNPAKYDRNFAEVDAYAQALDKVWEAVAIHKTFSK